MTSRPYHPPPRFLEIGKYLIPSDVWKPRWGHVPAPREQISLADLADRHPTQVEVTTVGQEEHLPRFDFRCYTDGVQETDCVLPRTVKPAYAAVIRDGRSLGRHCTVIGPGNEVVRESGFFLDPGDLDAKALLGRYGLRHLRYRQQVDVTSLRRLPPPQHLQGRAATLNMRCSHNYFHWLTEILPRLATLRRAGIQCDYYLVDCRTPFQQSVLEKLGIAANQLIQPHCRLLLQADELVLPSAATPECLRTFRSWAVEALGVSSQRESTRRIFISRRKAGTRRLDNERQLQDLLASNGFETHCFEDYDLPEQARLIHDADAIVATHGAGLANLVFARAGAQVIEVVPDGRYNPTCYPELSRLFGLKHQILFAQRARHKQVLRVSLDDAKLALQSALPTRRRLKAA